MALDLTNVNVSAFVEPGAKFDLAPPREYETAWGAPSVLPWILSVGDVNQILLYFRDPADIDRLIAELQAKRGGS